MTGIICSMVGTTVSAAVARTAKTITVIGNTQIDTAQSKFGSSSILFDGTNDQLSTATWSSVTGAFTIETFIRFNTAPATYASSSWQMLWSKDANTYFLLWSDRCQVAVNGKYGTFSFGSTMTTGTWYHIALVRNNSDYKIYFNGTDRGTAQDDGSWSTRDGSFDFFGTGSTLVGDYGAFTRGINGWLDEFRISNVARYTANFTPTISPFVNDGNTLLLLHGNGADGSTTITDDTTTASRSARSMTANGNVQIDTAQSKFGSSSILFDGTGDFISFSSALTNSDDFTVEGWVRFNSLPSAGSFQMLYSSADDATRYFAVANTGGQYRFEAAVKFGAGSFTKQCNTTLATNTWYHWAVVKNGATLKIFRDGTELSDTATFGTMTSSLHMLDTTGGRFGVYNTGAYGVNGWMDEIRVSDIPRYTSNFTPSTSQFTNDANTILLLHGEGEDGSTTINDDNS